MSNQFLNKECNSGFWVRQRWSRCSAGNRRCRPLPTSASRGPRGPCRPLFHPDRRGRSSLGTPMGPREMARYGLRAVRLGEASHPGPSDPDPGDRGYVLQAAAVAARVAHIDDMVSATYACGIPSPPS